MQAKLTITAEGSEPDIFLYTDCEYEYVNDTAQITYRDKEHGMSVIIGLNRDKVSLLRVKEVLDKSGVVNYEKQFNVLSVVRSGFKEMIEGESMEILCMSDDMSVEYNENSADISVKCFISVYAAKPIPGIINITCRAKPNVDQ